MKIPHPPVQSSSTRSGVLTIGRKLPPTPEAIANIECIARENIENVVTIAAVRKSAANKTASNVQGHEHVDVKGTTQENRLPKAVTAEPRKPLVLSACFVNSVKAETESAHPLKADPEKESRTQSVIRSNAEIEAVKGRKQEPEQRKKASGPAPRVSKSRTKSQSFPAVPSTVGRALPPKSSATRLGQNSASVSRQTTRNAYDILCEQIVDHVINEEGDAVTPPGQRKGRSHSRSKNNLEEQNVTRTATTKKTMRESRNTSSGIAGFLIDEEEQTGWVSQGIVSPLAAIDDKVFEHRSRLVRTPPDPLTSTPLASHSRQNPSFSSSPSPELHSESLFKPMLKSSARNIANTASTPTDICDESLVSSEFEIECESPPAKRDERGHLRPPNAAKLEEKLLPARKRLELRAQMETTARPHNPVISSRVSLSTSSTEVSPILTRMGESPAWEFGHDAVRGFGGTGMDDLDRDAVLRRLSVVSPLSGKELGVSNEEDVFGERLVTGLKRSRDLEGQKEYERCVKRPRDGKLDSELEEVKEELEDNGDTSLRAYNSAVDDDGDWAAGILDEDAPPEFFDLENVGGDTNEPW
ncbi:hypothetical protein BC938DRAFT_480529 [Jimgerdemannia flammicorona]|uniref:Uncharacterized protein n=1 Tax=Jimgerdemannia flammicorona TaxID=994334 RepID=A0A433QJ14_9FUNG|nr:hypothetical protein BC938DRAFT_480529 [Jimgerdemannia flammicorona]